jgi:hypothetical protein
MIEVRTESHYVYKIRFYTVFDVKYEGGYFKTMIPLIILNLVIPR